MLEKVKTQKVIHTVAEVEIEAIVNSLSGTLAEVKLGTVGENWPM